MNEISYYRVFGVKCPTCQHDTTIILTPREAQVVESDGCKVLRVASGEHAGRDFQVGEYEVIEKTRSGPTVVRTPLE